MSTFLKTADINKSRIYAMNLNNETRNTVIKYGIRDGFPIGLGYFAVSFSLGILARKAGLNAFEGFLASLFTRASAGEYGGYSVMAAGAPYLEIVLMGIITNLRYLLMNAALTQRFATNTPFWQRLLVGICCTDEVFGITIAQEGDIRPLYSYVATLVCGPMWACGTAAGIIAGGVLPARIVTALSVALYGMFLAIIIPVGKKDKAVLLSIIASFILSYLSTTIPYIRDLSSGIRTIILTIIIASVVAIIKPVPIPEED